MKAVLDKAQHSEYVAKLAGNRIIVDRISYGSYEDQKRIKNGKVFKGKECYLSNFFPAEIKIEDNT